MSPTDHYYSEAFLGRNGVHILKYWRLHCGCRDCQIQISQLGPHRATTLLEHLSGISASTISLPLTHHATLPFSVWTRLDKRMQGEPVDPSFTPIVQRDPPNNKGFFSRNATAPYHAPVDNASGPSPTIEERTGVDLSAPIRTWNDFYNERGILPDSPIAILFAPVLSLYHAITTAIEPAKLTSGKSISLLLLRGDVEVLGPFFLKELTYLLPAGLTVNIDVLSTLVHPAKNGTVVYQATCRRLVDPLAHDRADKPPDGDVDQSNDLEAWTPRPFVESKVVLRGHALMPCPPQDVPSMFGWNEVKSLISEGSYDVVVELIARHVLFKVPYPWAGMAERSRLPSDDDDGVDGRHKVYELLAELHQPTVIFRCSEWQALYEMDAIEKMEGVVEEDVSAVSVNPFRTPTWVRKPGCRYPSFPHGFMFSLFC
eukprot:TRINITY_DN552_c0_g2_i1.p1 TRINITY_DN552_c0_g2~~TRINITY_DN552_c0_g2_i1.p1  ORF type:complete len:428 (+),score=63.38 TRINITY_DN552_c0_g2_i1:643-1926(+)